jgi:hypothetical protein
VLTSAKHRAMVSVVGIVTDPRAGRAGVRILLVSGYQGTLQEVKCSAREVDHSVAEVKNEWSCTSAPSL